MTMNMIDRAALAMYAAVQPEWSWDDPDAELLRKMYKENVRMAVLAIRDDRVPRRSVAYLGHRRFRHQFEPVMRQVQLTI